MTTPHGNRETGYLRGGPDGGMAGRSRVMKMTGEECEEYWRSVHAHSSDDLAAVCFPDKPRYFNLFFDRVQRFAIGLFLKRQRIALNGWRWLDLGCGRGRWLRFFTKLGARPCGVDVSAEAVRHCRSMGLEAEQGDIGCLPFRSEAFDAASSITVLMHLPPADRGRAIAELSRVLAPGGLAFVLEATRESDSPHVYGMAVDKWEAAFAAHRLHLTHISSHCFGLWRQWLWCWLPHRDRIGIYLDYPVEFWLMRARYGRYSDLGWQHLMVFRKDAPSFPGADGPAAGRRTVG